MFTRLCSFYQSPEMGSAAVCSEACTADDPLLSLQAPTETASGAFRAQVIQLRGGRWFVMVAVFMVVGFHVRFITVLQADFL